jgi:hypothetical protein
MTGRRRPGARSALDHRDLDIRIGPIVRVRGGVNEEIQIIKLQAAAGPDEE